MAVNNGMRALIAALLLTATSVAAENSDPRYEIESEDGNAVSMVFYGPAAWLRNVDDGLTKFPHLQSLTLRCGKLGRDEVRSISRCKSIQEIFTAERHDSDSVEFLPGALGELAEMNWLKSLSIHSEPMPAKEWRFLSKLNSLESLLAEGISQDGVENIRGIESLESLSLPNSSLRRIPGFVAKMQRLEQLSITSTLYSDSVIAADSIAGLNECHSLRSLALEGVDNTGLKQISKVRGLQFLWIAIRDPSADLSPIGRLGELKSLTVSSRSLNDLDLLFLKKLPKLEFLQILIAERPNERLSQRTVFKELKNLRCLVVSRADEVLLESLASLPRLERVVVQTLEGDCDTALELLNQKGVRTK